MQLNVAEVPEIYFRLTLSVSLLDPKQTSVHIRIQVNNSRYRYGRSSCKFVPEHPIEKYENQDNIIKIHQNYCTIEENKRVRNRGMFCIY